ncbi:MULTISPECIES: fimbrial protein [Klebsiella]|uniref:fimbrial protein n=1 Tax=Klebsiella TaxID=570 RepID=UPI00062C6346|nr:fimbrial protein [Klebsiella michiganensis]MDU3693633.1 fimbrial protein [Klebsiella michiganensis]MDU3715489.1 fimbrial protein [Klebsiella michiganensis]
MINNFAITLMHKLRMKTMRVNNGGILTKSHGLLLIGIGLASIFIKPAWAYDANSTVNFNVTGKIEEPVCEVSVKPSSAINLGIVSYQSLTGQPGASSDDKAVSIAFDNCSTGTVSVTLTFSGNSFNSTYPSIYENEQIYGAKDVGLQLLSAGDRKSLGPNDSYTYLFDEASEHVFNMIARMYTPNGRATVGSVSYTVTFNVAYK